MIGRRDNSSQRQLGTGEIGPMGHLGAVTIGRRGLPQGQLAHGHLGAETIGRSDNFAQGQLGPRDIWAQGKLDAGGLAAGGLAAVTNGRKDNCSRE